MRMVYTQKGNLYIQDGTNTPRQLTSSGLDYEPIISDDGQKIAFCRTREVLVTATNIYHHVCNLHSISADGSQERPLVTKETLIAPNLGYSAAIEPELLIFAPGTHQVLFITYESFEGQSFQGGPMWDKRLSNDLLVVDIDSGKIKRLVLPGKLVPPGKMKAFKVSPDGNKIAVQTTTQIDVINFTGKIIHANLAPYPPGWELANISFYWAQDSKQLIMLPAAQWDAADYPDDGPDPRVIWKYSLETGEKTEIQLNPAPLEGFSVSPDGNWIAYNAYYYQGKNDENTVPGIYLGNLRDGSVRLINGESCYLDSNFNAFGKNFVMGREDFDWSPDSTHFVYQVFQEKWPSIGDINGANSQLPHIRFTNIVEFSWLDNRYYSYQRKLWKLGMDVPFALEADVDVAFIFMNDKEK